MHAIILCAGLGERMRPLTDSLPKPLLCVASKPMLQYHIEALARDGITQIVINHARFGDKIETYFNDGAEYGISIDYSVEGDTPLETGGGIKRALPLLGKGPFIVVNGDIWTDFKFSTLPTEIQGLAHIVLVDNPDHHPDGDFCLQDGVVRNTGAQRLTYSGIGVFRPELFDATAATRFNLAPLLRTAIARQLVTGSYYAGNWMDVGTPERLQKLDGLLSKTAGS